MGIYDRDYFRPQQSSVFSRLPQTAVGLIILVNFVVFAVDLFTPDVASPGGQVVGHWLSDLFAVHTYTLLRPWLWWQFLTAGFTHSPTNFLHIACNMFALFIFGRDIEYRYGSREFWRIYLSILVFANVVWSALGNLTGQFPAAGAYGASGAIAGIVILYALNFPRQQFLFFFVIPMPAWLLGIILVASDMFGAFGGNEGSNVAYSIHLAGAAFAFAYYQLRWDLGSFYEGFLGRPFAWLSAMAHGRPRLHIHHPDRGDFHQNDVDEEDNRSSSLQQRDAHSTLVAEVDRILEKIYRDGEASLTPEERKTLEAASREYQRRK